MSVEQYQHTVNSLDKEIVDLEKKKAALDKKAADARRKAASITISKSASEATIRGKIRQIDSYRATENKALAESSTIAKKIADKRKRRNDVGVRLHKEKQKEQKKQVKGAEQLLQSYERQIQDLQVQLVPLEPSPEIETDNIPEYDVFISHAWEDKEGFADEFVAELRALNINVWYDTSKIKWGDSMRKRIDEGLKKITVWHCRSFS